MDKTEQIKSIILKKYPSIRAFATDSGIPHGTIVSALNKGIESMSYGKVLKLCDTLQIDCGSFEPLNVEATSLNSDEKRLLAYYKVLDDRKRNKVLDYIDDIS